MRRVISYWKKLGCDHGLLLYASKEGARVYQSLGFESKGMLALDFAHFSVTPTSDKVQEVERGSHAEMALVQNWRLSNIEAGFDEKSLDPKFDTKTRTFARETPDFKAFYIEEDGLVVGSVACNMWTGPLPLVLKVRGSI